MTSAKTTRYVTAPGNEFNQALVLALAVLNAAAMDWAVQKAVAAFLERDGEALKVIKADDRQIDSLEVEVDEHAVALIALHQPVASDLRQILTTLKIANDLERIGDHAHNIAKAARRMARNRPLREIPELAELAGVEVGDQRAIGRREPDEVQHLRRARPRLFQGKARAESGGERVADLQVLDAEVRDAFRPDAAAETLHVDDRAVVAGTGADLR